MQKSVFIVGLAILIGLIANSLFRETITTGIPIGLGMTVFIDITALATVLIAFKFDMPLGRKGLYFLLPAIIFSLGFVFNDSPTLLAIDLGVSFLSLTFTALSLSGIALTTSGTIDYLSAILSGVGLPLLNAADLLYNCVEWDKLMPNTAAKHLRSVVRGLAIGLPVTAIFLALFVSADAAFAAIIGKSIKFDAGDFFSQTTFTCVCSWLAAGYFHSFTLWKHTTANNQKLIVETETSLGLIEQNTNKQNLTPLRESSTALAFEKPTQIKLGLTETVTVLGLVNMLFAIFVAVQLKFLFGGASLVGLTPGLSFAEYARKGFFDLNIACALVLPMLLIADHWLDRSNRHAIKVLRGLSFSLLGLLSVVMASALMRMHLYQTEYGQSELRLYTTAFMAWLGMVCLIFSGTVLTGIRKYFAFCSFNAGLIVIAGLHLLNPDAMIERANLSMAKTGKAFDALYAVSLSNDAIPALIKQIGGLPVKDQEIIARALVGHEQGAWHCDWRAFNISRMHAYQAVHDNLAELKKLAKD